MADVKPSKKIAATAQWAEHGEAQTGTRRIRIGFDLDETAPNGRMQDTVDLFLSSPGRLKVARKALAALGVDVDTVDARAFDSDTGLTKLIGGKRIRITYYEETDKPGRPWRATWINPLKDKADDGGSSALGLFGRTDAAAQPALSDSDDEPF